MNKILSLPLNSTSFGNISVGFLYELYLRKLENIILFDIGQPDLRAFNKLRDNDDFINYLNKIKNTPLAKYSRKFNRFTLWHINGSESSVSNHNTLMTFYELDSPTDQEINILNNQDNIIVSCQYTKDIFTDNGVEVPIHVIPLFFDDLHYSINNERSKLPAETCIWNIGPVKWERRKWTEKAIRCWTKKFAGNHQHLLNIACFNPFLSVEDNNRFLGNALNGNKPFNVNLQGYMETLTECNNYLNYCDIYIDPSGAEGFSWPGMTALCLGKHVMAHNVTGIKEWANNDNAVLFEPDGKVSAVDNIFFHPNTGFNSGNIFQWQDDSFFEAMDKVYLKWKKNKLNEEGIKLQEKFSRKKFVDKILEII